MESPYILLTLCQILMGLLLHSQNYATLIGWNWKFTQRQLCASITRPAIQQSLIYFFFLFIIRYLSLYKPYHYLLTKQADDTIEKFITKSKSLREFVKEIEKLKKMAAEISTLPPYAPMHFYWIDCTKLHKVRFWPIIVHLWPSHSHR